MSKRALTAEELTLPVKRTEGETLESRMTDNAYHNILPARYLRKDADGELIETQEDLFERIGKNIALAEAVYEAEKRGVEITVTPDQLKPNHPRRDELAAEVFGEGTTVGDDVETVLTEETVSKFAWETVVPELPEEVRAHVEAVAETFIEGMEELSFMPNSPTLMNAGDELQQLSACIAGHAPVYTRDGLKRMDEVQVGDEVLTHEGRFKPVTAHWSNGEKETIEMLRGAGKSSHYDVQLTPDHEVLDRETGWTRADEVSNPEAPLFPTDEAFPETIDLTQYDSRLKKEKPVVVDGGHVKLRNAEDPRTPAFDQQNNHPTAHVVNDDDLAWLIGLYLAEGDVYGSDVRFTLGSDEDELRRGLIERVERVFDLSVSVSESNHGEWTQYRISSSFVADFFATICGTGVDTKRIPKWVGSAETSYRRSLLDALLAGDGTELETGYRLVLANPTLVYEATLLARSLGYNAGFRLDMSRDLSARDTSGCYISTTVTTKLDTVHRREAETVEVYDMEVADDHSFVVGDFVVHNCFVMSPDDDLSDIHETAKKAAEVFQSGGGVGYGFWKLRPYGDSVGSTGGIASGPITFMRTYDQLCETIAQGGTRRGAQMGIMRISHPDVIEFIHAKNKDVSLAHCLRLNDPDDYTYTSFGEALEEARELIDEEGRVPKHLRNAVEGHLSNFNISVGVTDGFMEALQAGEEYTFTNPRTGEAHVATAETKEMYGRYGLGEYVEVGEELSIPAELVWERIVEGAHENGEPGVIYLERVNDEHSFDVEEHPDHRILATNPCLTGEMAVHLADGTTAEIGELAARDAQVEVKTVDDGELTTRPARAFMTKRNAAVVRVTMESERAVRVTPDHEIRTEDGKWVPAEDLEVGDDVLALSRARATPHGPIQETTTETVASIDPDGHEDVYDLTVEETHNFFASDSAEGAINVHNCGEQPLEEFEACNLGHINLSTLAARDTPDWRVWSERHADAYDSQAAAVEAFLEEAIDWAEFDDRIEYGTRFLENVVTMSDFPVEEIERTVREMRKIGLGIMGLAQLYIQLGVKYGSAEGNEIARQLMTHINHHAKWTSHELAEERGAFTQWDESKYADPVRYREWFEHQTGLDADEWADGFPIRNHNVTTIAPTGTTSMVGNTTGGCEPIYNVAYYKNVTDDVQGDEMLVEFDDYFLRVIEANDIDVEAVKREAQQQMATNEFDGVEGLSTVPDAIGELFVITADLSAKDHAAVQCACQEGVDSAISKTVNAPNDSTVEDAAEVFEWVYEHGGKGVTYYRDGTRSKQVLTTRAENTDFADEDEAAAALVERIDDLFGGLDAFLENETVREAFEAELDALLADHQEYAEKKQRPDQLHGVTQRIDTGYGKLYVTINEDPATSEPFELFANTGHSGGFTNSFTDALAKTISIALRSGVDPYEIVDKLQGIRSPKVAWDKGEQINSIPDAFGTALRRYLDDEIDKPYPRQQTLEESADDLVAGESAAVPDQSPTATDPETDGGPSAVEPVDVTQDLIDAGESPECPECRSLSLYFAEGCKTCDACGWSEC